jgi:hypothetical protein
MPAGSPGYTLSAATKAGDVASILAFFASQEAPGVRKLERAEVQQLVDDGLFYVARSIDNGAIVATTYLREQATGNGGVEYEIGGGLVAKEHQQSGLMKCLGVCAIVAQRLETPRDKASGDRVPRIVGRVECSNPAPIRHLLLKVGFKGPSRTSIKADGKPGLQEMPKDENGEVCVDEFEFDDATLAQRVEETLHYRDTGELRRSGAERVVIDIEFLKPDGTSDPLQALLEELRGGGRAGRTP